MQPSPTPSTPESDRSTPKLIIRIPARPKLIIRIPARLEAISKRAEMVQRLQAKGKALIRKARKNGRILAAGATIPKAPVRRSPRQKKPVLKK
jgi:hypothetical protein